MKLKTTLCIDCFLHLRLHLGDQKVFLSNLDCFGGLELKQSQYHLFKQNDFLKKSFESIKKPPISQISSQFSEKL